MAEATLTCRGLVAGYAGVPICAGLDLEVAAGEVVGLIGPNGAGKTTTLLTLAGALPQLGGAVRLEGEVLSGPLHRRVRRGVAVVTEERSVLMDLTAAENLRLGRVALQDALVIFPELEPLLSRKAGLLSGGEQQMLTLARALARRPRVLLVDELSLGLAPLMVTRLFERLRDAATESGVAVLIVEQHLGHVLRSADRAYLIQRGEIILSGAVDVLAADLRALEEAYLSGAAPSP